VFRREGPPGALLGGFLKLDVEAQDLLHRLIELRAVLSGQVQEIDDLVQLFVYIASTFAGDGQVEA
jgi:hypothetical protein